MFPCALPMLVQMLELVLDLNLVGVSELLYLDFRL